MTEVESRILAELAVILTPLLFDVSEKMIVPEANFMDDLGFDSLDMVELIMDTEEAFGFEISEEALAKIKTIGDLVEVIMATTGHKTAATTKSPGQPPNALEAMVRQFISAPG